jgi:hypothetical protein
LRHRFISNFASSRTTKKADRVEHLQWRSTRSAYSLASPRLMTVAVRLVFRLTSLFYYTSLAAECKGIAADRVPAAPKAEDFPELKPGETWSYEKGLAYPDSIFDTAMRYAPE